MQWIYVWEIRSMATKKNNTTREERWVAKFGMNAAYNTSCLRFRREGNRCWCKSGQEMLFCTNKCIYSTNFGLSEYQKGDKK